MATSSQCERVIALPLRTFPIGHTVLASAQAGDVTRTGTHDAPPSTFPALLASHRAVVARWLSSISLTGGLPLLAR